MSKIFQQLSLWLFFAMMLCLPIPKAGMLLGTLPVVIGITALMLLYHYIEAVSAARLESTGANKLPIEFGSVVPWLVFYLGFLSVFCLAVWGVPNIFGWERFLGVDFDRLALTELIELTPFAESKVRSFALLGFFSVMWFACWKASAFNQKQLKCLMWVFFIASLFQAVFGLWHFLSQQSTVFGLWEKRYYLKDVTGTFVNRNHFAGFLAICWPIVLSGLLAKKAMLLSNFSRPRRLVVAVFYSLIVFLAIVASHSRMGTVASLFGVIIWYYIGIRGERSLDRAPSKLKQQSIIEKIINRIQLKWFLISLFLLFIIWFGVDDLLQRYLMLENGDSRFGVWSAMFDLPFSALLFGIGPGAFADVFPLVQPSHYAARYEYAHNDYLELLFEFGLIGSLLLLLFLAYWFWRVFPRGKLSMRAGVVGAIAAMAVHSLVDFTLQIPASALYFWVAVGLLMNPNMCEGDSEEKKAQVYNGEIS